MTARTWKKVTTVTLAMAIAAGMTACGNSNGGDKGESGKPKTEPAAAEDPNKVLQLEWLTYQYGPVDENSEIKKKLEEDFHVKFNIWYLDVTKRNELLGAKLAAGQFPDFMTVYSSADLQKFFNQGVTVGFTEEELTKYMPKYKALIDSFDPKIWTYAKYKGQYIGIPSLNAEGDLTDAVAWRKDWLDKVGIAKIPETLDEYKDAVYKFRNNDPDGNGKKDTYGLSVSSFKNIYGAYGVYPEFWTIRDGKMVWSGILPETKRALQTLAQWKKDDVISPEWVLPSGENNGGYWALSHDFINGKIGTSSQGANYHWTPPIPEIGSLGGNNWVAVKEANPKAEIGFGAPPIGPDGKFGSITPGYVGTAYMAFGKNADPEKKHRIMQMWDKIYSDLDLWKFVKFGPEGKYSEIAPDGKTLTWKEEFKGKNELQAKIGGAITFSPFDSPKLRAQITNPAASDIAKKLYYHKGAGYENALKTSLPSQPKYEKDLLKLQQETFTKIINGEKPIDEFDKFVEAWKSQGGDTLTQEANDWYNSLK